MCDIHPLDNWRESINAADDILIVCSLNDGNFFSISDLFSWYKDVIVSARLSATLNSLVLSKCNIPCFLTFTADLNLSIISFK